MLGGARYSRSDLKRVIVAIDPAVTWDEGSDDTGIIVVARGPHRDEAGCKLQELTGRCPGHGVVLDDRTCHLAPHGWARQAVAAYDKWQADRIVAEVNNGGDMVGETIHAVRAGLPYTAVHATRGKRIRAEPCAALTEQGRMHFLGDFPELRHELETWTPDSTWSPNRLDALVWGCTALGLIGGQGDAFLAFWRGDAQRNATPRPERDAQALQQMIRRAPKYQPEAPSGPTVAQRRCSHRWRGDRCVFCSLTRAAIS